MFSCPLQCVVAGCFRCLACQQLVPAFLAVLVDSGVTVSFPLALVVRAVEVCVATCSRLRACSHWRSRSRLRPQSRSCSRVSRLPRGDSGAGESSRRLRLLPPLPFPSGRSSRRGRSWCSSCSARLLSLPCQPLTGPSSSCDDRVETASVLPLPSLLLPRRSSLFDVRLREESEESDDLDCEDSDTPSSS